jgi:hypothetical protein
MDDLTEKTIEERAREIAAERELPLALGLRAARAERGLVEPDIVGHIPDYSLAEQIAARSDRTLPEHR